MISRIISGGRTRIERAAIEKATELGIRCGGWVPKAANADREFEEKFGILEMPADSPLTDIEQNIQDSDGVLLFSHGDPDGTVGALAEANGVPFLHLDMEKTIAFNAVKTINPWIVDNRIEQVYVTGRDSAEAPDLYEKVSGILEAVIYFDMMSNVQDGFSETPLHSGLAMPKKMPASVQDAVDRLISKLSLKDKATIANMMFDELPSLMPTVGEYIRTQFGISEENSELVESSRFVAGKGDLKGEDVIMMILTELWNDLRETHKLKVVK